MLGLLFELFEELKKTHNRTAFFEQSGDSEDGDTWPLAGALLAGSWLRRLLHRYHLVQNGRQRSMLVSRARARIPLAFSLSMNTPKSSF
jgi:hypothetical protein